MIFNNNEQEKRHTDDVDHLIDAPFSVHQDQIDVEVEPGNLIRSYKPSLLIIHRDEKRPFDMDT